MLQELFEVTVYFDNPNIHPAGEYQARLSEIRRLAERWDFPLVEGRYDSDAWLKTVKGHEDEPEGSIRCEICYRFRLERTAREAKTLGMDCFAATLSISPHKKTDVINRIGRKVGQEAGVAFFEADFKKKDGFKKSCELSRAEGLYRQNYCGCAFSKNEKRISS
jgi:predicted adenine nucleotide alpha hydrolase (AANH) superfamily ATPase